MFLDVAETIAVSLLCCGVGIVKYLFNIVYTLIGDFARSQRQETTEKTD